MDYGKLIEDSFTYAKEGLLGNIWTWILLIVLAIIPAIPVIIVIAAIVVGMIGGVPNWILLFSGMAVAIFLALLLSSFLAGYEIRILRGTTPLPPVSGFGAMFFDGIRYIAIQIIYMIPVIIVVALTAGAAIMTALSSPTNPEAILPLIGGIILGIIIALILAFIIGLFAIIGVVRFARTGRIGEAFNFSEILATIRKIGWGHYILALIIVFVIVMVVEFVVGIIPVIGGIINLIIVPWVVVFMSRYISLLYDSAGAGEPTQPMAPVAAMAPAE
ncbi:hypothetical protein J2741_001611 [Methanolinea mesophila]|uniref:DUF4013 domain-containing protein n=1 Tax=Methanolinea mesophila TaxID=547055 RepID=UPI001AEA33E4|nr:DUF4013 domain-containing protein [Methanolinea mesophila]MBP1929064.1 hypothetical protein [Methanolinea mesophila]